MISRPTILVYHAIGPIQSADDHVRLSVPHGVFVRQMHFLERHRRVVSLAEAMDHRYERGRPRVAITFDDGYRCVRELALPVLEECGFPATVFVPTGAIGDRNTWDSESPPAGLAVMSMEELREVEARGLTVESHGHGHVDLAAVSAPTALDDLSRSVAILSDLLGRAPKFLAYPWGQVTPDVEGIAADLGFLAAFTIGVRDRGSFAHERVPVRATTAAWKFRIQTSGYWSALRFSRVGSPIRVTARALGTRWQSRRKSGTKAGGCSGRSARP